MVLTADPLRPIRVYQETGRRCTPTVSHMGKSQSRAGKPLYARPICTTHLKVLANKEGVFQKHGKTESVSASGSQSRSQSSSKTVHNRTPQH